MFWKCFEIIAYLFEYNKCIMQLGRVVDAGPTENQSFANVSCLLGCIFIKLLWL